MMNVSITELREPLQSILQTLCALISSIGFSMIFDLKGKKLICAALGGGISWAIYLLLNHFITNEIFICYLIASLLATNYSQLMARVLKAPATVFIFPSIVPLVPGNGLYYTMRYIVAGEWDLAVSRAMETLKVAVAIAFGIVVVIVGIRVIQYFKGRKKRRALDEKKL